MKVTLNGYELDTASTDTRYKISGFIGSCWFAVLSQKVVKDLNTPGMRSFKRVVRTQVQGFGIDDKVFEGETFSDTLQQALKFLARTESRLAGFAVKYDTLAVLWAQTLSREGRTRIRIY